MFDIVLALLFIAVISVMVMLIIYSFTDKNEQKLLNNEMYAELKNRDESYKRYMESEKKADEVKKDMRTGSTSDQFYNSVDVMQKLSERNRSKSDLS